MCVWQLLLRDTTTQTPSDAAGVEESNYGKSELPVSGVKEGDNSRREHTHTQFYNKRTQKINKHLL